MPTPVRSIAVCVFATTLITLPASGKMSELPESFVRPSAELSEIEQRSMPQLAVRSSANALPPKGDTLRVGGPLRFADPIEAGFTPETSGTWELLDDGSRLWRLRIRSEGARHLNLGFERFEVPEGARLWVYNPAGDHVEGPYTAAHRTPLGRLWTPIIYGQEIVIELHLPAGTSSDTLALEVGKVNHGFLALGQKQGSCNIDTICPEADPWSDQVRAVVRYSISGIFLCTGTLVNNTSGDGAPLILSAAHCGGSPANTDSIVTYWNFESPVCGQLGGGDPSQNQTGAIFRAAHDPTDLYLFELTQMPDPAYAPYYAGWDASGNAPQSSVSIHHPSWDEKAISFENDPATTVNVQDLGVDGPISWQVIWNQGTTEGGSSGSGLFDTASGLIVGTLWGGEASCSFTQGRDFYAKLDRAWDGGGTPSSRLRDWLDPVGSGATTLDGMDPDDNGGPTACRPDASTLCLDNRRFQVTANWTDFSGGSGPGRVVATGSPDVGVFYFFRPDNWELMIKVIDGCSFNDHFWVFASGSTNVEYEITVTDTVSGEFRTYGNPLGEPAMAVTDTQAFATCP